MPLKSRSIDSRRFHRQKRTCKYACWSGLLLRGLGDCCAESQKLSNCHFVIYMVQNVIPLLFLLMYMLEVAISKRHSHAKPSKALEPCKV